MIVYDKSWWGDAVLARMYGSAFPRALPYSLGACALAAALSFFFKKELDTQFVAPYPFQTFAFIVGSLVVFRCASRLCPQHFRGCIAHKAVYATSRSAYARSACVLRPG